MIVEYQKNRYFVLSHCYLHYENYCDSIINLVKKSYLATKRRLLDIKSVILSKKKVTQSKSMVTHFKAIIGQHYSNGYLIRTQPLPDQQKNVIQRFSSWSGLHRPSLIFNVKHSFWS